MMCQNVIMTNRYAILYIIHFSVAYYSCLMVIRGTWYWNMYMMCEMEYLSNTII
jgi:hypothetical protein